MAKKLWLTILLAAVFQGLGHIYLGFIKRGIIILVVGIALWIISLFVFPGYIGWVGGIVGPGWGGAFWIWQLWDAYKHYKKFKRLIVYRNAVQYHS